MKEIKFDKDETEYLKKFLTIVACTETSTPEERKIHDKILKKISRAETKIKPSSAKAKGRDFQYKICQMIADKFGVEFVQSDDDCLIHSREMGQHGKDIVLRGEVKKKFPYSIECKAQESVNITEFVNQARENSTETEPWLLIFKKKSLGSEPLVCLEFSRFLSLFSDT